MAKRKINESCIKNEVVEESLGANNTSTANQGSNNISNDSIDNTVTILNNQDSKTMRLLNLLTRTKGLKKEQRIKINALISRDIKNPIQKEVEKKSDSDTNTNEASFNTVYVSPKALQELLFRFNQDEVLRYTCHEIDSEETIADICKQCGTNTYVLQEHAEIIKRSFKLIERDSYIKKLHPDYRMVALIRGYLTGKAKKENPVEWSTAKVAYSWLSSDLMTWARENPGLVPNPGQNVASKQNSKGYKLPKPFKSPINGKRIQYFNQLSIYFKTLFHIRRDNSLRSIIDYCNKTRNDSKVSISYSEKNFKDNIELLTNVERLKCAYEMIVEICKEAHTEKERIDIELEFYESGTQKFFCIHDLTGPYGKSLNSTRSRIGEAQRNLIEWYINGLCNLSVEADFGDGECAHVDIWNDKSSPLGDKPNMDFYTIEKMIGVKYILEF